MAASPERNKQQIFIGNLSRRLKQEDVEKEFARFGTIKEVNMKSGFAFVVSRRSGVQTYEETQDADEAVKAMDRKMLDGETIKVEIASKNRGQKPFHSRQKCRQKKSRASARRQVLQLWAAGPLVRSLSFQVPHALGPRA